MPSAKSRRLERAPDSPWITVEVAADWAGEHRLLGRLAAWE